MAIYIDEKKKVFTLHTDTSTYQMRVHEGGFLIHQYYGKRIDETDLSGLIEYTDVGFSGNPREAGSNRKFSLDTRPQEYTSSGIGDYRICSIDVENADGTNGVDFRYVSHQVMTGKYSIPGMPAMYDEEEKTATLAVTVADRITGLQAVLYYCVWEELDMITRAVQLKNNGESEITLQKAASVCVDFPYGSWELMNFHGRHLMERQPERRTLMHGVQSVGSVRGSSSHQHNPFVIMCEKDAAETYGECYGFSLVYSGNFEAQIEVDQMNQTRLVMGIHSRNFSWILNQGESFFTPEVVMTYSENGFEQLSHKIHAGFREHLCRGKYKKARRPILLNNWEATYFDFDEKKILDIARGAAEVGVEMLVLDDGWFGKRDSDCTGLGDWDVNTEKLKGGLQPLAARINEMGLKFGLWFEPEMVSEDSDLYRQHPDWALQMPGRAPGRSRSQLVLDMSRKEVVDYLYGKISHVLDSANIEYIKWDMNRSLSDLYSAELPAKRQGEVSHRYVLGVYDLMERLCSNYPEVLIEGCSGGGGRFDPGILYYSPQIWCSDDTDAVERVKIQYGTSFGYPVSAMGSHVSAVPNHQTGRVTSLDTRAVSAMSGSFGYELDLNTLSDEEKEIIKEQIARFKKYYDVIQDGKYYRLSNPMEDREVTVWQYVSADQSEALLHGVIYQSVPNAMPLKIKWKGLKPDRRYQIAHTGAIYSGTVLMNAGILLPVETGDNRAVEIYIKQL